MTIYVNTLDLTTPETDDPLIEGPARIIEIKTALQNTFTNIPNVIDWNTVFTTGHLPEAGEVSYPAPYEPAAATNVGDAITTTYNNSFDRAFLLGADPDRNGIENPLPTNDATWLVLSMKTKGGSNFLDVNFGRMFNHATLGIFRDVDYTGLGSGKVLEYDGANWVPIDTPSGGIGHGTGSVTEHNDVSNAGSGAIITNSERSAIGVNSAKVSATGSVTTHSDVSNAGSGEIITDAERTAHQLQLNGNAKAETDTVLVIYNGASYVYDPAFTVPDNWAAPISTQTGRIQINMGLSPADQQLDYTVVGCVEEAGDAATNRGFKIVQATLNSFRINLNNGNGNYIDENFFLILKRNS